LVTPPAPPHERERPAIHRLVSGTAEMIEVADEDLVEEPSEKELDIEWAPVPAVPGFSR
jgi:hypothetical protein